jgi:predicted NUDIX family phosphoesterase
MLVIGDLPEGEEVSVRETDQLLGEWINIEDLRKPEIYDNLETWSQFVVDTLN